MDKLEQQLNDLPRYRLSRQADLAVRGRLYFVLLKKRLALWKQSVSVPRLMRPVAAACGLALVFSLPVYAYASPDVYLGHPLYAVKTNLEQMEGLLVGNSGEAAVYHSKLSGRRLAEAEKIAVKGEDAAKLKATVQAARQNSEISQAEAVSAGTSAKPQLAEKLSVKRQEQEDILIEVAQRVGISPDEELTDTIASALEEVKSPPGQAKKQDRFFYGLPAIGNSNPAATNTLPVIATSTRPSASTAAKQQINREKPPEKKTAVQSADTMGQVQTKIQELKGQLQNDYDEDQVSRLFDRLDKKMVEAQERIDDNDLPAAAGLLNSTEALTNNAKHFLRPRKSGETRQDGKNEKDDNDKDGGNSDFNKAGRGRGKSR